MQVGKCISSMFQSVRRTLATSTYRTLCWILCSTQRPCPEVLQPGQQWCVCLLSGSPCSGQAGLQCGQVLHRWITWLCWTGSIFIAPNNARLQSRLLWPQCVAQWRWVAQTKRVVRSVHRCDWTRSARVRVPLEAALGPFQKSLYVSRWRSWKEAIWLHNPHVLCHRWKRLEVNGMMHVAGVTDSNFQSAKRRWLQSLPSTLGSSELGIMISVPLLPCLEISPLLDPEVEASFKKTLGCFFVCNEW